MIPAKWIYIFWCWLQMGYTFRGCMHLLYEAIELLKYKVHKQTKQKEIVWRGNSIHVNLELSPPTISCNQSIAFYRWVKNTR